MATYEFPFDNPSDHCLDHFVTGGKCCGDEGLARVNCKLLPPIDGHNKTREQNRDDARPFPLREIVVTGVFIFFAVFFGLSQLNKPAPLCAPTVNCEAK